MAMRTQTEAIAIDRVALQQQKLVRKLLLVAIFWVAFLLRVYHLETIPNGLFIDEAARGYDAFSIALTGADMFGEVLPLFPRGFDDYTPALYTYLAVPFVYLFDLSRFSTRYAAVWVGIFTVAVAYVAMNKPFGRETALAGAMLLALSPWYILLSRIGTEWTLLGLGPMLTIVLLYCGLSRPNWLIAAGLIGGLSLYGYAPVKVFLPLLLAAFVIFYWVQLWGQKWAALVAVAIFALLAYPVYTFSFTPEGQVRFQEVYYFDKLPLKESLYLFLVNYLAYLDPRFLFIPSSEQVFVQSLRNVGLFYWFELPLITLGIVVVFKSGKRDQYFWLVWLLLAPLGINLHIQSPKPALWLTATPILHGLAGAGLVWLIESSKQSLPGKGVTNQESWPAYLEPNQRKQGRRIGNSRVDGQRNAAIIVLAGVGLMTVWNVRTMVVDLFTEFPLYSISTKHNWWAYDMERAMTDINQLGQAFDSTILQPFELEAITNVSGIYFAFYNRFSPQQRQQELLTHGPNVWQQIGPVTVGQLETGLLQPGCHLAVIPVNRRYTLPLPNHILTTYNLDDKQVNPLVLIAVAGAQPARRPVGAVFGEQILLESFSFVSNNTTDSLLVEPGQALCLVLNWQSAGNLINDYTVFIHLVGPANPAIGNLLWSQHDSPPVDGLRPTTSWQPGEVIQDMRVIFMPMNAPKTTYQLQVGLYNQATGERLPVQSQNGRQDDHVTLLEVRAR